MVDFTEAQKHDIAKKVAIALTDRGVKNPSGFTLFSQLRKAAKYTGIVISNLQEVNSWFPDLLSVYLDEVQENIIVDFLASLESKLDRIEKRQKRLSIMVQFIYNHIGLSTPERTHREPFPLSSTTLSVVVVGVVGGNRQIVLDKIKGFPIEVRFKHYHESIDNYGHFDYCVYFAKHGKYYRQSMSAFPGKVLVGTGGVKSLTDLLIGLTTRSEG